MLLRSYLHTDTRVFGDHFPYRFADFSRVTFRPGHDGFADAAKNHLPRMRINEVENQRTFAVLTHVGVGHRRAWPHGVIAETVGPAAHVAIAPVGPLLHRDFFLYEDMPDDVEIGLVCGRFRQTACGVGDIVSPRSGGVRA